MYRIIALLVLAAPALPAWSAQSIDYSYVDGVIASREGPGSDFEGPGLRASMSVAPSFFVAAEFYALALDDLDRTDIALGMGYRMPLNRHTDFVGQVDYVSVDTGIADDDGLRLGAGVRSLLVPELEVRGALQYVDVGGGDLVLELGAQYMLDDAWAAFLEVTDGGDFGGASIGVRLDF